MSICVHIHSETEKRPGPDLVINCPACHNRDASATTYDQRIQERIWGLIPVNDTSSTWVVCTECNAILRSRVTAAKLKGKTADELSDQMYFDAGLVPKVLAMIGIVLAIFPFVGLVMAAIALFMNRKSPTWARMISVVALILSLLTSGLFGVLLVFEHFGLSK